ncbi:hypothetical protein [Actinomyces bouchesdurhonensis]|uniref:hypothetical protein n=1 Tax=Actinomyces bouchesdurhonensis TaxID=1852361 RepID=UPI0028EE0E79|nr:hypothetical protein [Actinomyces bouchesdurhonensis]
MTTSNDDQTMQLPEFDATTPLPTIPDAVPDATVEMPTSDPLAVFRDEPNTQMPSEPAPAGGFTGAGARTAFDPASTGESVPPADEAGAGLGAQAGSRGASAAASPAGASASGAQTWSAPAWPASIRDLPEAPSRGVRVGAFTWAILVCMVGAFLIAEAYIPTFNLPILGISAIGALGVILIVTAIFSGRPKEHKDSTTNTTSAADAIRFN